MQSLIYRKTLKNALLLLRSFYCYILTERLFLNGYYFIIKLIL